MMGVSEFAFDKYIMLEILSTKQPFPLRKDGPTAFPLQQPIGKRASGTVDVSRGFRWLRTVTYNEFSRGIR
jgi:hypothetical protein